MLKNLKYILILNIYTYTNLYYTLFNNIFFIKIEYFIPLKNIYFLLLHLYFILFDTDSYTSLNLNKTFFLIFKIRNFLSQYFSNKDEISEDHDLFFFFFNKEDHYLCCGQLY